MYTPCLAVTAGTACQNSCQSDPRAVISSLCPEAHCPKTCTKPCPACTRCTQLRWAKCSTKTGGPNHPYQSASAWSMTLSMSADQAPHALQTLDYGKHAHRRPADSTARRGPQLAEARELTEFLTVTCPQMSGPSCACCFHLASSQVSACLASTTRSTPPSAAERRGLQPLKGCSMHCTISCWASTTDSVGPSTMTSSCTCPACAVCQRGFMWHHLRGGSDAGACLLGRLENQA